MKMTVSLALSALICAGLIPEASAKKKTAKKKNVILIMADDISAREFPTYKSSAWHGKRAVTPVMDKLSETAGCYVETAWANTICKPTRIMIMSGRYAHLNKYWDNKHIGADNRRYAYNAYKSSRVTLGNLSRDAGYANIWVSKTHINDGGDTLSNGFNECVLSPGETKRHRGWNPYGTTKPSPYPRFHSKNPKDWDHESFYWWPEIQIWNHPDFPNKPNFFIETKLDDYAPDIELNYVMEFMDRSKKADKPFFVYYTPHLGHTAKDYADLGDNKSKFVGTPVLEYESGKEFGTYKRLKPKHTKLADGTYKRENITEYGMKYHVEYLDYQIWQLIKKLKAMGEYENTVIIFTADNATQPYGKAQIIRQKGTHVPLMVFAPGEKSFVKGKAPIISDLTDIQPTLADIMGYTYPEGHVYNGKSLWPYLTKKSDTHREWIYSMRLDAQMMRTANVIRDGKGEWYDARVEADDFDSYPKLDTVPEGNDRIKLLKEKALIEKEIKQFDLYYTDSEAPQPPKDSDNDGMSDEFEMMYSGSATAMKPNQDLDRDGTNNYYEFVYGTDPKDRKSPTAEQKPHLIEVEDAQGKYIALQFQRRAELGPNYWCNIKGSTNGKKWKTDGVIQQHSNRLIVKDGIEIVTARVAATKDKCKIKHLKLEVLKPKKRRPRKFKGFNKKKNKEYKAKQDM